MATAPILVVDSSYPQPRHIARAVAALEAGNVIAYPTDTCYAFGCDLFSKSAVEQLRLLKRRDPKKPFAFLCHDESEASRYAVIGDNAHRLIRRLTPGPYTFVLAATRESPRTALTKRRQVGVRIPDHAVPQALLQGLHRPLATTTATSPEGESLVDARDIQALFGTELAVILDGGYHLDEPSTVLDLSDDTAPVVLRMGKGGVAGIA